MLRAVLAPIAGYVAIGVLVIFTDRLFSLLTQGFNAAATPPRYYYVVSLLTDSLYSILGGYICAGVGGAAGRRAALILMVCGELIGLAAVIALWQTVPHWFAIALLIVYPLAVWAGSQLRMRSEPSPASS